MTVGSFRFRTILDRRISAADSLTMTVLHGVTHGVCMYALLPTASGTSVEVRIDFFLSISRFIAG